jgi:hypothetical protein
VQASRHTGTPSRTPFITHRDLIKDQLNAFVTVLGGVLLLPLRETLGPLPRLPHSNSRDTIRESNPNSSLYPPHQESQLLHTTLINLCDERCMSRPLLGMFDTRPRVVRRGITATFTMEAAAAAEARVATMNSLNLIMEVLSNKQPTTISLINSRPSLPRSKHLSKGSCEGHRFALLFTRHRYAIQPLKSMQ